MKDMKSKIFKTLLIALMVALTVGCGGTTDDEEKVEGDLVVEEEQVAAVGNICTGYIELSEDITENKILDGCYKIMNRLTVSNDALLTINPGSTLLFDDSAGLQISNDGALKSIGTAKEPILFTGEQKAAGYWGGIYFWGSNNTQNEIAHTTIEYAGGERHAGYGALYLNGDGAGADVRLKLSNTTIKYSGTYGFYFDGRAILDKFENITSTKNAETAGRVHMSIVDKLDSQSDFTGNLGDDYITVGTSGGWIKKDTTWKALSVPLNLTGSFAIDEDVTLTIEPASTLVFDSGKYLSVSGGLKAIGTALKPILFTGKGETAGYWSGITFFYSNNADNILDYVTVEYGGNNGKGGLFMESSGRNSYVRISVTNSTFKDNSNYGLFIQNDSFDYPKYNKDIDTANTFINNESGGVGRD